MSGNLCFCLRSQSRTQVPFSTNPSQWTGKLEWASLLLWAPSHWNCCNIRKPEVRGYACDDDNWYLYAALSSCGLAATNITTSIHTDTLSHERNMNRARTNGFARVSHLFHNSPVEPADLWRHLLCWFSPSRLFLIFILIRHHKDVDDRSEASNRIIYLSQFNRQLRETLQNVKRQLWNLEKEQLLKTLCHHHLHF